MRTVAATTSGKIICRIWHAVWFCPRPGTDFAQLGPISLNANIITIISSKIPMGISTLTCLGSQSLSCYNSNPTQQCFVSKPSVTQSGYSIKLPWNDSAAIATGSTPFKYSPYFSFSAGICFFLLCLKNWSTFSVTLRMISNFSKSSIPCMYCTSNWIFLICL